MTQLVELQEALPKFIEAGIKVYAISYDEVGALADFAAHHDITYELLADQGSQVIRDYGILNHLVTEEQIPYHGIPFPGTYLVDEHGVVAAKAFHAAIAQRESAEGLIDAALGELLLRSEDPSTSHRDDSGIDFSLIYHGGGGVLRGGAIRRLIVRVDLPEGLHIYDEPVPEGMVATSFTVIEPSGLRNLPVEKPPTTPLELPGVGELRVWSDQVDFVIPVWATDEVVSLVRGDNPGQVTIKVAIRYQACDDSACRLPVTETLTIDVPVGAYTGPALRRGGMPGATTTSMDTMKWMGEMVKRGMEATPDPDAAAAYLQRTIAGFEAGPMGTERDAD